jgi:metal-responsive CopG/Arc/MetJ family transcriptional regulator
MQNNSSPKQTSDQEPTQDLSGTTRINISISKQLLHDIDKAAKQDYTTRSDIIRIAALWYLRPQGRELDKLDPETIYNVLRQRHMRAGVNKMVKDLGKDIDAYDS